MRKPDLLIINGRSSLSRMAETPLVYRVAYKISGKGIYRPLVKLVRELGPFEIGVDIGSGYGIAAELIADHFERLYLIDLDQGMAKSAKKRLKDRSNVEVIVTDAKYIPLQDSFADFVYFFDSLHHIPKPQKALLEAIRIIKSHGKLAVFDLDGCHVFAKFISFLERASGIHSRPLGSNVICNLLGENNLVIIRSEVDFFGMFDVLAVKEYHVRQI
ncbi:MAG TPA: class I SAM-dependent methyltransferase [Candidatus Korarchaeota archaeon]|nr:class I SAM-dependent methyltransferase [Candidatus Korarchaeota archaeon]